MASHRQQSMIPLFLYGDLTDRHREEFERHLATCDECRKELEDTRKLHAFLAVAPAPDPDDSLLRDARMQAQASLQVVRNAPSLSDRVRRLFAPPVFFRPALGLAAVALLVTGFLGGRLLPHGATSDSESIIPSVIGEGVRVTNVQLVGGTAGGDIDLVFEAVTPMSLRGSIHDPAIQKVLAYAMVNGENAGVRLRAVGSISSTQGILPEREVKAALLLALKSDQNDGVRKEALHALLRYPADRQVRDALLEVLLNDANPGLRVAAINALDTLRTRGYQPDEEMIHAFRQRLHDDDNLYVRVKAQSLMEEKIQ